jgi:hypothetical protein
VLTIGSVALSQASHWRPIVGAIRWDAWSGGEVTEQVERSLGPPKYHSRLPWFAKITAEGRVRIDAGPQSFMDQEIEFAAAAGLDYWGFLLYPEASPMSQSLKNYLKSTSRGRVNFCLILHNAFGVSEEQWPRERDRAVAMLTEAGYQTVLNGRPLVYAFGVSYKGQFPAQRFAEFRRAAAKAGVNPYCVYMGWDPASDFRSQSANGFDAVSAYAYASSHATFRDLCQAVEQRYWHRAAVAHVPYVPLVTTGWDKRPRQDNPVSWERDHAYHRQQVFPTTATPQEIASHLERALRFVKENREACEAQAIIIYSWNEHDEGGWLEPTWTPGGSPNTERLDRLRPILRRNTMSAQPSAAAGALPQAAER